MTASVCSSKDCAKLTDSRSSIRVGEGDRPQIVHCFAYLLDPGVPSIGGSEN